MGAAPLAGLCVGPGETGRRHIADASCSTSSTLGECGGSERKAYFYLTGEFGSVAALADESGMKVNPYSYRLRGVTFSAIVEKVTQPYRSPTVIRTPPVLYHVSARC